MDGYSVLWAIGIAIAYVIWPILGKLSGVSGAWVGLIVVFGTLITIICMTFKEVTIGAVPSFKAITILLIVGLINGFAVYFYSVKTADIQVSTGAFIVLVTIFMVIFAPLLDWALNGSVISIKQWGGLAMTVVAIYLLKG